MAGNWITLARTCLVGGSLLLASGGCALMHGPCADDFGSYCDEPHCDGPYCNAPNGHRPLLRWPFHFGMAGGGGEMSGEHRTPPAVAPNPRMFPVPTRPVFGPPGEPYSELAHRQRPLSSPRTAERPNTLREPQREGLNRLRPMDVDNDQASSKSSQPARLKKPAELPAEATKAAGELPPPPKSVMASQVQFRSDSVNAPKSTVVMRVAGSRSEPQPLFDLPGSTQPDSGRP